MSLAEWKAIYDRYGMDVLKNGQKDRDGSRVGGCYAFDPKKDPLRIFKSCFGTNNPFEAFHSPFHSQNIKNGV